VGPHAPAWIETRPFVSKDQVGSYFQYSSLRNMQKIQRNNVILRGSGAAADADCGAEVYMKTITQIPILLQALQASALSETALSVLF
jgi:hypothetical protein